jgi:hypothetical protein
VYLIFCQDNVFSFSITKNSDVISTIEKLNIFVVNNWSTGNRPPTHWDGMECKTRGQTVFDIV